MDIRVIRRHNLLHLVREAGGQKRLAERTGVSAAYLSQVLSRKVNRHVGHSLARRLESGMEKPYGWMDVLPPGVQPAAASPGTRGRASTGCWPWRRRRGAPRPWRGAPGSTPPTCWA
jgi:transcriptional regulator with XRE-family HTH domain